MKVIKNNVQLSGYNSRKNVIFTLVHKNIDKMAYIDIEIDKLTHSIENVITGDSFPTEILSLSKPDLIHLTPKNAWKLD